MGGSPLRATSTDAFTDGDRDRDTSGSGGATADNARTAGAGYDFARLERAVAQLVEQYSVLQKSNAELRTRLADRDARVRSLEEQLRTANQLRQDVAKRIDELIGQIDQLDAELETVEAGSGGAGA